MNPYIALSIFSLFALVLFTIDIKLKPNVSSALWIVTIWMMVAGSRNLSYWLSTSYSHISSADILEGSPIDRVFYFTLNIAGLFVLYRRRIVLGKIVSENKWVFVFMLYGFISIIWSEIPFVAFKRFFKTIGNPIMALVVLSEAEPLEALKTVFRRCAYMLLLFSIATIKYFPHIGRQYHVTGDVMFRGVTGQKNELGLICLILGTAFLLGILRNNAGKNPLAEKKERYVYILLACISAYLLIKSNSATSLLCFIVGIFVMITTRYKMFQNYPKRLNYFALGSVVVVLILEYAFDVKSVVIASLGRDSSLTTRVPMWEFYRNIASNPIVGAGFESFWTYDRMELARAEFGSNFSVHSGYLDLYLNLGIIGVCLFGITIVAIYRNINQDLAANRLDFAIYRLIFMTIILLYSYTEAYFVGVNMFYFMYYFVLLKCPVPDENVKYANNLSRSQHGAAVPQE